MASNDNGKCKLEEEVESLTVRKRLRLSDDDSGDDDSSDSLEVEMEEVVSSETSSMNQLNTSEEKFLAKRGRGIIFVDDGNTTSPLSEPRPPEMLSSRVCSDPDNSNDDDDDF
jgi:hypothetical protein